METSPSSLDYSSTVGSSDPSSCPVTREERPNKTKNNRRLVADGFGKKIIGE
jgi:hypothetical protein